MFAIINLSSKSYNFFYFQCNCPQNRIKYLQYYDLTRQNFGSLCKKRERTNSITITKNENGKNIFYSDLNITTSLSHFITSKQIKHHQSNTTYNQKRIKIDWEVIADVENTLT